MPSGQNLLQPSSLDGLLLFRLARLVAVAGAPVIRLCEGRYGITRREWRLIAALAQEGPMLSSTLAGRVYLERGRTSKAVSDLIDKGLAVRTPRTNDRRKADIALTDKAHAIYASLFPEAVRINQALLDTLSAGDVAHLDMCIDRIQARAQEQLAATELPKADRRRGRTRTPATRAA